MSIRVLVAAEVCFYREGLISYLDRQSCLHVTGAGVGAADTLELVELSRPDVVLLDIAMADSLRTVRTIRELHPAVRVLALAVCEEDHDVIACAEAGVAGYVHRTASLDDVVQMIESVSRGECMVSPRVAASLLRKVASLASDRLAAGEPIELTTREAQIVGLIEHGLSNKQIAARLGIGLATAKNHVHNILDKLKIHRRSDVARRLRADRPATIR